MSQRRCSRSLRITCACRCVAPPCVAQQRPLTCSERVLCRQLAVEDTGIGIREEDMQRLFGLFSKIRDKRVDNSLGVGLGLAICKQLVEMMRGQIHVISEYGKGTKFFFTMLAGRASTGEVEEFKREVAEQRATNTLAAPGKVSGRVLVVEDNEFNIEVVRAMLENAGHTVDMAMDGQDGVEKWQVRRVRGEGVGLRGVWVRLRW